MLHFVPAWQVLLSCHSIFAKSLARFAFSNPNGITYCYATFDLLLQNLPITKEEVIDSFCFSQPKRHNLRLCCVWPVAAKLVDNKTLFCHFSGKALNNTSEQSEESLSSAVFEISCRFLDGHVGTAPTAGMTVLRFGSVYIELWFFLLCNTEIQTLGKKVCCTDNIRSLLLQQRVYLQQQAFFWGWRFGIRGYQPALLVIQYICGICSHIP